MKLSKKEIELISDLILKHHNSVCCGHQLMTENKVKMPRKLKERRMIEMPDEINFINILLDKLNK
jgi:hypothetical protein